MEPHELKARKIADFRIDLMAAIERSESIWELDAWWKANLSALEKIEQHGKEMGKGPILDACQELREAYSMQADRLTLMAPKEAAE